MQPSSPLPMHKRPFQKIFLLRKDTSSYSLKNYGKLLAQDRLDFIAAENMAKRPVDPTITSSSSEFPPPKGHFFRKSGTKAMYTLARLNKGRSGIPPIMLRKNSSNTSYKVKNQNSSKCRVGQGSAMRLSKELSEAIKRLQAKSILSATDGQKWRSRSIYGKK